MFSHCFQKSARFHPGSMALGAVIFGLLGCIVQGQTKDELGEGRGAQLVPSAPQPQKPPAPGRRSGGGNNLPDPSGNSLFTTITAQKRLLLDSLGKEATFWGDVKVVDPRFSLACEKLTVFFRDKTGIANAIEGKDAKEGKAGKEAGEVPADGALERVVAEGDVVIFQEKTNDRGEIERSVGRAHKAVYDTKTGNISLSGWPQVEQKQNTIVAMEESTVILLNRKGTLEVLGHSKSVLRNSNSDHGR
jgi:lipopolysaccharide export system protein LptA